MSDRYRPPPTGPKGKRNYNEGSHPADRRPRPAGDKFTPTGPKRFQERDNYRPSSDSYKSNQNPNHSQRSFPTGPSGAKPSASGTRSAPPAGPSGYKSGTPGAGSKPTTTSTNGNYYNNTNKRHSGNFSTAKYDPLNKKPKFNPGALSRVPAVRQEPLKIPTKLDKNQIYSIRTARSSEIFQRTQQVGEGTYGKVYKAKNQVTSEFVALKRLRLETEKEGFPITAIREIKLLQSFDHKNVIGLLEMMVEQNQIFMIFDYMEHDLTGLLTHPELKLEDCHRKFLFKQLMEGTDYLHQKRIMHRDIKGSNILIDNIGRLKIADFGLARPMKIVKDGESPDYTNRVITIWYRPPELLLGSTDYGRQVDIWGVGCLLIELYTKHAIFQGYNDEVSQLHKIFNIMGTPTLEDWPDIQNLPWFEMLKPKINKVSNFEVLFKHSMTEDSFDLALKLLQLNPNKRLTAHQALNHHYFTKDPKPEPLFFLKELKGEWHEFETKKLRRKERKRLQDERERQKASGEVPGTASSRPNASPNTGMRSIPIPPSAPHTGPQTAPNSGGNDVEMTDPAT
ncbi:serine/threonine protein kinase, CMGC, CDC2/CDK sub [Yamadazyma tenuis]|uniref:Pkinase-domain-containing protein n=1 Tax=Candida tenuis (strain ATCC 10573 / BCRC 21748 / CBS 615 / JCM 9827 / NBRC 10315 / NRRL Y-1498 / VKM Y-70) TaxID=590646 RepID=G3BD69_CANTC|nr:Pkinase-domain-containing protein [Yamadazyma tenuis ATCC 10573]EGV60254.1 Pkinase-domain-containing protein [Yamadazyma tenuis ATCC 10573]WEJ94504.1 serine/threonine protein kinase, CMGC, CDC2/CDK sub [Yamadazyma tenuis]